MMIKRTSNSNRFPLGEQLQLVKKNCKFFNYRLPGHQAQIQHLPFSYIQFQRSHQAQIQHLPLSYIQFQQVNRIQKTETRQLL